jgi:hypothetical protein
MPLKVSWVAYLVDHVILLTQERVKGFGIALSNRCPIYFKHEETQSHLLFLCFTAQLIWKFACKFFVKKRVYHTEFMPKLKG